MIEKFKLGNLNIKFVVRHYWDSKRKDKMQRLTDFTFKFFRIGFFFKKSKLVGRKDYKNPNKWHENLVNSYMVGLNLIILSIWVEFNLGALTISLKEN